MLAISVFSFIIPKTQVYLSPKLLFYFNVACTGFYLPTRTTFSNALTFPCFLFKCYYFILQEHLIRICFPYMHVTFTASQHHPCARSVKTALFNKQNKAMVNLMTKVCLAVRTCTASSVPISRAVTGAIYKLNDMLYISIKPTSAYRAFS